MTSTPTAVIGANVRAEMARTGVSQAKVADHLGTSQSAISARLRGSIAWDVNELTKVAELLGVSLSTLLPADVTEKAGA